MKKCIALLLAVGICLSGCITEPLPTSTSPAETTVPTESAAPTQHATLPTETIPVELPEPADSQMVRLSDYLPDVREHLVYATEENFTGQVIYDFSTAYLRYGTVKKLKSVSDELAEQGLGLLIWDGFRPVSAQFRLWEICPDANYVSNPHKGFSSHSRGNTIDLTLVDQNGVPLEMPTDFDDFTALADRDYSDCSETAAANATLLESVMEKHGFSGYSREWWHFTDTQDYPATEDFEPQNPSYYLPVCDEFISLRQDADTSAEVIVRIPKGDPFLVFAFNGTFALAQYNGWTGYVHRDYIAPVLSTALPETWAANCQEYISLRSKAGFTEALAYIPAGGTFSLLQWQGRYARISYDGQEGYVLSNYIKPAEESYFSSNLCVVEPTEKYSYEQMLLDLDTLAAAHPEIVTLASIGTSELGRDIPVLLIGDPDAEHHVLLQGAIHGREHMTAWLIMALTDFWLARDIGAYGDICYHVIPMSNPDGVAIAQSRKLNSTQSAIYARDIAQGFTSDDPEAYAALWKANALGIDLNRNFPAGWSEIDLRSEPSSQLYRGDAPFCAAETAALRDYTMRYPFDATISYHAAGSFIYYEYGNKESVNLSSESLGNAVSAVTGYPLQGSDVVDSAGYKDWVIDDLEIPSLTIEIGCDRAPLDFREIYSIFARNCGVLPAIAQWLSQ